MFALEWLGNRMALRANNGKYVCTKKNGQLLAVSDSVGKPLVIELISLMFFALCETLSIISTLCSFAALV